MEGAHDSYSAPYSIIEYFAALQMIYAPHHSPLNLFPIKKAHMTSVTMGFQSVISLIQRKPSEGMERPVSYGT